MTNNLRKAKKDLCSFAKKCKDFKYTDSALITFLITGAVNIANNLFSAETGKSIENQKQVISTSIKDIHNQFTEVRRENDKLLKKSNMELIKLMEQGDHVVKSPWSSWQFGINNFYNDWHGTYKGYGGKAGNTKYTRNPDDKFGTYSGGKYGVTTLSRKVIEPVSVIPIYAAVRPKDIHKTPLNLNLPIIEPPQKPNLNINVADPLEIPEINVKNPSRNVTMITPDADPFTNFVWGWRVSGKATTPAHVTPSYTWKDALNSYINQTSGFSRYGQSSNFGHMYDYSPDQSIAESININGGTYWTGVDPATGSLSNVTGWSNASQPDSTNFSGLVPAGLPTSGLITYYQDHYNTGGFQGSSGNINMRHYVIAENYDGRWTGHPGNVFANSTYHVAGDSNPNIPGSEIFHIVGDVHFDNVTANLYGHAAFANIETFRGGITTFNNVKINLKEDNNTVFNIVGWQEVDLNNFGRQFATKINGSADITADTQNNTIYALTVYNPAVTIKNTGILIFNGASNIGFSVLSWNPDRSKYIDKTYPKWQIENAEASKDSYESKIITSNPIQMYGDENVGIFFSAKKTDRTSTNSPNVAADKKEGVGIHQGTFDLKMEIGRYLNSDTTASAQSTAGQLSKLGYTSTTVDGNVGVFVQSGQREGINIIGTSKSLSDGGQRVGDGRAWNGETQSCIFEGTGSNCNVTPDKIHDLYMDKFNITFGKYAKNGFMFLVDNGSVVHLRDASNNGQNDFSDGINGGTTDQADTGTGTVVGYVNGLWKTASTHLDTLQGHTSLENMPSELKVDQNLTMVSDKGIAYYADNGGLININKNKTTTAKGYGSIIGYANNHDGNVNSTVNFTGNITAIDDISNPLSDKITEKYTNIGAYAKDGGVVNVDGKATIYGIGGFADNGEVNLKNTDNEVTTVKDAGLVAKNGGKVNFNGGKIIIKNDQNVTKATSTNATPFYAKATKTSTAGTIIFNQNAAKANKEDSTVLEMYDGVVLADDPSEYKASASASSGNYRGLENVTLDIHDDKVIMGVYNDKSRAARTWYNSTDTGATATSPTFTKELEGVDQFGKITFSSPATFYTVVLKNGKLDVNAPTVTLDDANDKYKGLKMANELVTISSSTSVTGNVDSTHLKGQGMSMGNIATATQLADSITPSNSTSGFINKGTINVKGGTVAAGIAGMNVSYGTIENTKIGKVTIDNGAGLYATNGSKIINEGKVTVTGKGVGIAGIGTGRSKQTYGTDDTTAYTTKTVEIVNKGTLNVAGDEAIGIYAENNTGTARANVTIENTSPITVGTKGVGIALVSTAPTVSSKTVYHSANEEGGTITATASGGTDITTGVKGTGIYAEDSDINLTGGDYIIETKDKGVGIFASGRTNVTGSLEYKYNGSATEAGMGIVYNSKAINNADVKLTNSTNTTGGLIGVYTTATANGDTLTNNKKITGTSSALEFGIVSDGANIVNSNKGEISLGNAALQENANVGIYAKTKNTITNDGKITVGDNAIGIYGYNINNNTGSIKAGDNGVAIYTQGDGTVNLNANSKIIVGKDQAVGVYAVGANQHINVNAGSSMTIGDNSFGIVNLGAGNTIASNTANPVNLGTDAVYVYQNDNKGTVINHTPLTSTGDRNYGLYGNGNIYNDGVIDFSNGIGNVGMYATTSGTATNLAGGIIKVGDSDTNRKEYGVGMATGYYDDNPLSPTYRQVSNQGTIINQGTIEVSKPDTIGMYAVGSGSKAINYGNINLMGSKTVGMYIDRGAVGENWGTIQTTASGLTSAKGVYVANGGYIKNYGVINIAASDSQSAGIWTDNADHAEENANGVNPVTLTSQTGTSTPRMKVATASDMKEMGGVIVKVPPKAAVPTVADAQGNIIPIYKLDTDMAVPQPAEVIIKSPSGVTPINLSASDYFMNFPSSSEISSIGMYVDTSGVNYTNPIQGLNYLTGLTDINLLFGAEATRYTTAKAIEVGDNILKPYNDALKGVVTGGTTLNVISSSLTWMAQPTKNPVTELLDKLYLIKVPYTVYAEKNDRNTYNFLDGLEQRYGVEGLGTREKLLFDKISSLNGGEGHILAQAFDEMKGHQYANIQQRTNATGNSLDSEFKYLKDEWRNPTKQNNKIKAFGLRDEYNTDTPGIIDYKSNSYGVAYVHEDEKIKMGNSSGWYAGAVTNRFRFKDLGHSTEDQTMIKAGIFKTMSPKKDYNGALQWTVAGDIFAGINNMKRKFWIVDDTFEAKSTYHTYGAALKNELGYDIRMSERTHLRPYGALKMEYGRFSNIKENDGEVRLEVKGNDYFSVKPEAGLEFKYIQPLAVRTNLTVGVTAAYENELGKLQNRNQARVRYTTADWYNLEKEKEDKRGNGKFDLNIGVDNTRFGVTVNAGYDTKGNNIRGGIGFRAIY
ncbi:autotransporter-associated N-terminal domain-containing protein [Leptotrichia wadei]|uniref:autotransporter-associated N-terminal domain-containing protein n=1 Tax=Leptotrichia wadei TaxID=157687 RepID=UPI0028EF3F01|nr:autotransporter-associated N-terminal domain-containing protein [Leptotrichia wadei]